VHVYGSHTCICTQKTEERQQKERENEEKEQQKREKQEKEQEERNRKVGVCVQASQIRTDT
jgi:hypothetical protein